MNDSNLDAIKQRCNKVIHDIHTPLLTIKMLNRALEDILPQLVSGYSAALEHNLLDQTIDERKLDILKKNANTSQERIDFINQLIDDFWQDIDKLD